MRNLVLAISLALASSTAMAESGWGGGSGAPPAWHEELGITDEQREEMRKVHEAGGTRDDIRAVLTPEQQKKIVEMKTGKGSKYVNHLKKKLDLSDEQVAEMEEILEEGGNREDLAKVLTPEQKAQLRAREETKPRSRNSQGSGQGQMPWFIQQRMDELNKSKESDDG